MLAYHRPSGLTHMLASPLPEIWGALDAEPVSAETLLERLSAHYDLGKNALRN
jgi:PqqD family protein of HPr-rel-A system